MYRGRGICRLMETRPYVLKENTEWVTTFCIKYVQYKLKDTEQRVSLSLYCTHSTCTAHPQRVKTYTKEDSPARMEGGGGAGDFWYEAEKVSKMQETLF